MHGARGEVENTWLASRPGWAYGRALNSTRYRLMRAKEAGVAARTRLGLGQGPWVGTMSAVVDYEV